MDNSTFFIIGAILVFVLALIFFNRVKINSSISGFTLDAKNDKNIARIERSKKIDLDQSGASTTEISDSEDVKIKQNG